MNGQLSVDGKNLPVPKCVGFHTDLTVRCDIISDILEVTEMCAQGIKCF